MDGVKEMRRGTTSRRTVTALLAAVAAAGCPAPPLVNPVTPVCRIAPSPRNRSTSERGDTIRIVLPEPVDPARFPLGDSESERLLLTQLYEPLVRRDCAGTVIPGLADRWVVAADSAWRFRLRDEARFSDGTAAGASAVAAMLAARAPDWVVRTQGDREIVVRAPGNVLPGALAAGRFAIARAAPGAWPAGTVGTITPRDGGGGGGGGGVTFTRPDGVLSFTWPVGADARDLLEGGADAVLTDQTAAIEYAGARGTFDGIPLPWSRTYVLAVPPGGSETIAAGASWRDAVRTEARAAVAPFWWTGARCGEAAVPPAAPTTAAAPARVVYLQSDRHARGLAERLVARGVPRAAGLALPELRAAIAAGTDYAIVALPRLPGEVCAALTAAGLAGRPARSLLPLVDTRFQLVVRSGRFGVSLDGDGTPRIDP